MKKILLTFLLTVIFSPILILNIKVSATELPTELPPQSETSTITQNFVFYDNSYYDLSTGEFLTETNHSMSDLGFYNDFAKAWVSTGRLILNKDNVTNLTLKNDAHYILFWNSANQYIGYYKLFGGAYNQIFNSNNELIMDDFQIAKDKFLGVRDYESINPPQDVYRIALMTNLNLENSQLSSLKTFDETFNSLEYVIDLPVTTSNYHNLSDLFEISTINYDENIIDLDNSAVGNYNGIDIEIMGKQIRLEGTVTQDFSFTFTNSLPSGTTGYFTITKVWGQSSTPEMNGGTFYMTDGTATTYFYHLSEFEIVENPEMTRTIYNEDIYTDLKLTLYEGFSMSEYIYEIEFHETMSDLFIEVENQSQLDALDSAFNQENAYYSGYTDTPNTAVTTFMSDSAYNGNMRFYDAQKVIDLYKDMSNYEIDLNDYNGSYDDFKVFSVIDDIYNPVLEVFTYTSDYLLNSNSEFRFLLKRYHEALKHQDAQNGYTASYDYIFSYDYLDNTFFSYDSYINHTYTYLDLLSMPSISSFVATDNNVTVEYLINGGTTEDTGTDTGTDTPTTDDPITDEEDIKNINVSLNELLTSDLSKMIFITIVLGSITIALFIFKVKWLIILVINILILVTFVSLGWLPSWLLIVGIITIMILILLTITKY